MSHGVALLLEMLGVCPPVPLHQKFSGQLINLCTVHLCEFVCWVHSGEVRVCFIPAQAHGWFTSSQLLVKFKESSSVNKCDFFSFFFSSLSSGEAGSLSTRCE